MRLAKEGSRRKLGRFSSFGCGGFEFHGKKLAESAGDSELAHSPSMATREGEGEESEVQTGVRQVASSEGRAWTTWLRRWPGKRGDPPRRQSHGVEELREGRELADGHALPCAEQGKGMTRMEGWMTNGPWLTVF